MFKLRNFTILCSKWASFKWMPATGLKIIGTGHVYHGIASPLLFKNSLKMSGHRGYEFLEFLLLEFGPILAWYRFPAAEEVCGHLWCIFRLMMRQMFSIGERSGLQAGQFSTRTLLLRSHAVVIAAVCGFALSCWNRRHLEGSICCSKNVYIPFSIHSAFQNMQAAHTVCTYTPPYHQRCWLLNWMLMTH